MQPPGDDFFDVLTKWITIKFKNIFIYTIYLRLLKISCMFIFNTIALALFWQKCVLLYNSLKVTFVNS